ncbi:unnamed protein product [Rhizophagus irregularis]|nr:unnamed protein product [Rhizophagus irregularis]CAB5353410.1 unnamed protein product [Rhizophagus irregularis]
MIYNVNSIKINYIYTVFFYDIHKIYIKRREDAQRDRDNYRKALIEAQERKRLRKTQGDRVKEEDGIESDSDEDEADQVVVSIEEPHNKRGGKPGSRGRGRGGRRRLVKKK